MAYQSKWFLGWAVACLVGLASCGTEAGKGRVTGRVTLNNQPLEKGSIKFIPTDGKSPTAGAVITNGEFTASVPTGVMRVEINAPRVVGKKQAYKSPDSPYMDVVEEAIPSMYNAKSTLSLDVKPGNNPVTYDLKRK